MGYLTLCLRKTGLFRSYRLDQKLGLTLGFSHMVRFSFVTPIAVNVVGGAVASG